MTDTERRYTRGLVEVRGEGQRSIGGYAAKFNRFSQNLGGFVEQIHPSFFNKSAGDGFPGVMARYNHSDNMLLGTTAGGTLRLAVDGTGLDYTVDPPAARADVVELITRGDVRQSSFAFRTATSGGDDWGMTEQGFPLRTLLSGALVDVAPVNTPAYLDTSTGLRSLAARLDVDPAEVEQAAQRGELRKFLGKPAPIVVDLGKTRAANPSEAQPMAANPTEDPADATLAPETRETLGQILQLIAAADNAVDVAQELLSDLLGVPNPDDADEGMETEPDGDEPPANNAGRSIGQGATHPAVSLRQRRTALLMRRLAPMEQGATHSAPSTTNDSE